MYSTCVLAEVYTDHAGGQQLFTPHGQLSDDGAML